MGLIEYSGDPGDWAGMVEMDQAALIASATDIPVKPPRQWFDDPGLTRLSALNVENNGRVYGHIASWEGSHIGRLGKVKPPRSASGYQYFRHGVVETDDGTQVPVGQITLVGGHADVHANMQAAVAHYDDTQSAVMDVTIGEDRHGIWVAGALRPDVDDIKIRAIRASGVSGDWRPVNNRLELVAICAVNVPGFPIPRALAASADDEDGHRAVYALVAAGVEPLYALAHKDPAIEALEYALLDIETKMDWMRTSLAVLASAQDDPGEEDDDDASAEVVENTASEEEEAPTEPATQDDDDDPALTAVERVADQAQEEQVQEEQVPEDSSEIEQLEFAFSFSDSLDGELLAQEILTASAGGLLWSDGLPIQFTLPQCEAVALRLKFRKALDVDPSSRAAALTAGAAMPDGRLPILSEEDLGQALLVVPAGTEHYAHLTRRATALGLDIDAIRAIALTAAAGDKYDFKQRLKMAKGDTALKDGSYPIADEEDLKNAIQAIGRAKDPAAAKSHIMKRARALHKVDLLPEKWS